MVHRILDARARPRRIPLDGSGRIIYLARADELSGYLSENRAGSRPRQGIAGISHFASAWILPRSLLPNVAGYGRQNVAGAIDDRTGPVEPPLPAKAASGAASDLAMRKKLDYASARRFISHRATETWTLRPPRLPGLRSPSPRKTAFGSRRMGALIASRRHWGSSPVAAPAALPIPRLPPVTRAVLP